MDNTFNLSEALLNGVSEEDLIALFNSELDRAREALNKKKLEQEEMKRAETLSRLRAEAIASALEYFDALGVIDADEMTDEDCDRLLESMKAYEPELKRMGKLYKDFTNLFANHVEPKVKVEADKKIELTNVDDVIADFIKMLGA